MMLYSLLLIVSIAWVSAAKFKDQACEPRSFKNKSVVCVCTADYCDTVIRETPNNDTYYIYSSSLSGKRFKKNSATLSDCDEDAIWDVKLALNRSKTYQTIYGFGAAVTDAAAINYMDLDTDLRKHFVESYCGSSGLQYSMLRIPIGGTAFSTRAYAYNMDSENDTSLSSFELTSEDYDYKIPLIKACMEASSSSINMLASMWSPPAWMKTNNAYNGFGWLKEEYYQTLADYFYKFLEAYEEENISMWGVTITNEPGNGIMNSHNPNSLGWTLDQMANWLINNLGPTLRSSSSAFKDIKILAVDGPRYMIPVYYSFLGKFYPEAMNYIDGCAVHWYGDKNVSATVMQKAMEKSPNKFLLQTEASIIPIEMDEYPVVGVDYGSWTRAQKYIRNILQHLNYNSTGWLDFNMALNTEGGPNWLKRSVDAPIIVNATAGEFYKQPMYYAMGHFSKFIPQGSVRIHVTATTTATCATCASCDKDVEHVAMLTPENTIVVVLYNRSTKKRTVIIELGDKDAEITIGPKTVSTIEFPA